MQDNNNKNTYSTSENSGKSNDNADTSLAFDETRRLQKKFHKIFDKTFKCVTSLSSKAVVNMINGLYGTNYPPDSRVTYPSTDSVNSHLDERYADVFITINDTCTYHMEAQMTEDKSIIFRVFEYGFMYAQKHRSDNTLQFPEPKILYLYSEKDIPENYVLKLQFGSNRTIEYPISTFNFITTNTEELNQKKLILLIPFQLLKIRKLLQKDRSLKKLEELKKLLIYDILEPIEMNYRAGNIELADAEALKELTRKMYFDLYAGYSEMEDGGINDMVDDITELECFKIIAELKEQVEKEVHEEITQELTKEITDKVTKEVTNKVTQEITDKVTKEVTNKVTKEVTDKVTKEVTDRQRAVGIKALIETCFELGLSSADTKQKLIVKFSLDETEAENYIADFNDYPL